MQCVTAEPSPSIPPSENNPAKNHHYPINRVVAFEPFTYAHITAIATLYIINKKAPLKGRLLAEGIISAMSGSMSLACELNSTSDN